MEMKLIRTDKFIDTPYGSEIDTYAIYLTARKSRQSAFGTQQRFPGALLQIVQRTGFVDGEDDNAGVQSDIPRRLTSNTPYHSAQNHLRRRSGWIVYPGVDSSQTSICLQRRVKMTHMGTILPNLLGYTPQNGFSVEKSMYFLVPENF